MYRFMEPDLTIYVMSLNNRLRAFLSHRKLLAQYSGYFKTLEDCETNKIFIPDITDDTFSIILSYVYTGMLKINNINIHSVLLATHTLHMPQASDMCRQFLITQDQNIIKPIAKLPSFTDASVIQQPNENRTLKISEESNFKPPIQYLTKTTKVMKGNQHKSSLIIANTAIIHLKVKEIILLFNIIHADNVDQNFQVITLFINIKNIVKKTN
ncbi:zinc finger and BTB domain-containing protein 44 isoform X2 [Sipha flava]|uniref:Zinc finger and BTB domain-containing protein 44 isoform X2 n=1 Tax=Sipha flava TaxID=143950 RepID=A0A8B8G5G8_9HEMI|nr:zinc finger and BTB domain-containing protein 44 isoform X2 [Sipha flava]